MPDEVSRDMSWSSLMIRRWEEEDIVGGSGVFGVEVGWAQSNSVAGGVIARQDDFRGP